MEGIDQDQQFGRVIDMGENYKEHADAFGDIQSDKPLIGKRWGGCRHKKTPFEKPGIPGFWIWNF